MFYKYPKSLNTNERYKSLSNDAKFLYMHLLSLHELSEKNNWRDADKKTFVICTRDRISSFMGISTRTATRLVKSLSDVGLIEVKKQRGGNSPRIYVNNLLPKDRPHKSSANTNLSDFEGDEISRALIDQFINS